MSRLFECCVVVGTGLIGASLAGGAKARGLFGHTIGVGRWLANLETARARGLVDEVSTDLASALSRADFVVVATPVATAMKQLHEIAEHAPKGAVFTDVGSVKLPIVTEAARLGLASRFVGAHPLAGKAETGAAAADVDLFRDRRVVLTPDVDTPDALTDIMRRLWAAMDAEVLVMDASAHDEVLATSSHLPQMVAFALAAAADGAAMRDDVVRLVAGGFRDTTRLAASDADMWADIAHLNREPLVDAMDEFSAVFTALRDAIADGDEKALRSLVAASQKFRREIATS